MAKKVKKKTKNDGTGETIEPIDNALAINSITSEVKRQKEGLLEINRNVGLLGSRVWELEQLILSQGKRIDRLVDALSKSRTVKGI